MSTGKNFKKNIILFIFLSLFCFTVFNQKALARENVNYWYIKDFNSTIEILENDSAIITEDIIADCGYAHGKHGIFRIVPTQSKTPNGTIYTPVELISITDFQGNPYKYKTQSESGTITWQIGNPNITVYEENNYRIKYKVKNIIREQENFDEFYWNLSGNYWDLEIDNFKTEIILPEKITKPDIELSLYDGNINSKDYTSSSYKWLSKNEIEVKAKKTLKKNEGITLSLSFPKGYINHQTIDKDDVSKGGLMSLLFIITLLGFPFLAFIISFIFYKKKQRKNFYYKKAITAEYSPPENISPLMLGFIKTNSITPKLVTASIIRMATLKIIVIKEQEYKIAFFKKKFLKFIKTKNQNDYKQLDAGEKYIFNLMFNNQNVITSSQLKRCLQNELKNIGQRVKSEAKERVYLEKKPDKLKRTYLIGAILSFFLLSFFSIIIFLIFYNLTRNLSKKGEKIRWQIKGFKSYMTIAEKDRHAFYEKENIFTKLLPYAIALGTVKEWVKKMEDIYGKAYIQQSFYWYGGMSAITSLSSVDNITSSINSITQNINSSMGSNSGSGGGGFSGGGGGGGGGGGW